VVFGWPWPSHSLRANCPIVQPAAVVRCSSCSSARRWAWTASSTRRWGESRVPTQVFSGEGRPPRRLHRTNRVRVSQSSHTSSRTSRSEPRGSVVCRRKSWGPRSAAISATLGRSPRNSQYGALGPRKPKRVRRRAGQLLEPAAHAPSVVGAESTGQIGERDGLGLGEVVALDVSASTPPTPSKTARSVT